MTKEQEESGIYGKCDTCEQPIFTHMEDNMKIFDINGMCGACTFGEAEAYYGELT